MYLRVGERLMFVCASPCCQCHSFWKVLLIEYRWYSCRWCITKYPRNLNSM